MNEQFSIAGKVAVITGAGGVLGGSIAKCFMQQGAKVVAVDIRQEQLDNRIEELKQYGQDVIGIIGDVLDIASLEQLADDIVAKWGRIDILLNIAGGNMPGATLAPDQHFYDMDISCWEKVTNLNMNGTVYPSLVFIPSRRAAALLSYEVHSFGNPNKYKPEEYLKEHDFGRGHKEIYACQFKEDGRQKEASNWYRMNPHRLHLELLMTAMYSAITTTYRLRSVMNTISMNTTILTDRKQTFLIRAIRN